MKNVFRRRLLRAVYELEPLLTEIATLLDRSEADDDPAELERALTDGYAQALTLEAERSSLERRVLRLTLELDEESGPTLTEVKALAQQLHHCEDSSERLRGELDRLKARHSRAVHDRPGWAS